MQQVCYLASSLLNKPLLNTPFIYKAFRLKSLLFEVFYPKSFTDENVVNGVGL